ncbi:hypothetical protein ACLH2J_01825 [Klebsiella michiganensis]|uniref:hypothetical protein n=1 Tax=Klebsiella michiganensis TaxID=1134687 RepID=UPI0039836C36
MKINLNECASNIKSAMIFVMAASVVYNMIIVPVLAAFGVPAPVILIDEATKFLLTIGALG